MPEMVSLFRVRTGADGDPYIKEVVCRVGPKTYTGTQPDFCYQTRIDKDTMYYEGKWSLTAEEAVRQFCVEQTEIINRATAEQTRAHRLLKAVDKAETKRTTY